MAYEAEKNRIAEIISQTVGITRTRDSDLEREADERAGEARYQTGLYIGDSDGLDDIAHPPHSIRLSRLNVPENGSVFVAELATWNYRFLDPIDAAAEGLLNSEPHRQILDMPFYTHWGIGIHTEMAPETEEWERRWWVIIWLSNKAIGTAALAQPAETLSKKVSFAPGRHYAYQFDWSGKILATKQSTFATSSQALAKGRGRIPNRNGVWLLMANGVYADHWVEEDYFVSNAHERLS